MREWTEAIANGRVNLIGEHTDYNGGWVLPTPIPQFTKVEVRERGDARVEAQTTLYGEGPAAFDLGQEVRRGSWIDYVQGATQLLRTQGFHLQGFDLRVESTVPCGSGLSSSAALEVALLKALRAHFKIDMSDIEIAKLGQRIENEFVGAHVGIMDPMAAAMGHFGEALFLDAKTLEVERVPLPLERMDLVVIDSGVSHQHSAGDYNRRRAECEEAARLLGVPLLRELTVADLPRLERLSDLLRRRARHVITENDRVHRAVMGLKAGDLEQLGQLFYDSHASQRDDFEVSIPEIDLLVEFAGTNDATIGARLTGGGFGGSIVALTEKGRGGEVADFICAAYEKETGKKATTLVP